MKEKIAAIISKPRMLYVPGIGLNVVSMSKEGSEEITDQILSLFQKEIEKMETGIFIRAEIDGRWDSVDIGDPKLSDEKVLEWLRSRGGNNPWAENCALLLLGREPIAN